MTRGMGKFVKAKIKIAKAVLFSPSQFISFYIPN